MFLALKPKHISAKLKNIGETCFRSKCFWQYVSSVFQGFIRNITVTLDYGISLKQPKSFSGNIIKYACRYTWRVDMNKKATIKNAIFSQLQKLVGHGEDHVNAC